MKALTSGWKAGLTFQSLVCFASIRLESWLSNWRLISQAVSSRGASAGAGGGAAAGAAAAFGDRAKSLAHQDFFAAAAGVGAAGFGAAAGAGGGSGSGGLSGGRSARILTA